MELVELLQQVKDRDTFLRFVKALHEDVAKNPDEWQNASIEHFLESAAAWMQDSKSGEVLSWKLFAKLLYAGKIYE